MFKKIRQSSLPASLCIGGYSGWALTVMYICERSLYYYRDDRMIDSVNITYLLSLACTLAGLVIILLLLDIEGLLSNKVLRWLPGVFMMESGIALCVANADSMRVFSAFAGVAAALGVVAMLTQLLRIKVGKRMRTIGAGLALGAGLRLLAVWIISYAPQKYFFWVAIGIGVITALTVHSCGLSSEPSVLVTRAEAAPFVIMRKMPGAYLLLLVLCVGFCLAYTTIENSAFAKLPAGMESHTYEFCAYSGYMCAAVIVALFVTLSRLPMLYVCASGMAATAGCLALLPHFSSDEIKIFSIICFAAVACYKAFVLLFIIVFSLDRPHPLFYAVLGYLISAVGELLGNTLRQRHDVQQLHLICLLLALMPICGLLLGRIMSRSGLSRAGLEHRHNMRSVIHRRSSELELFDRERMMVECVVLDGYNVDELASKLLFSRNTVKALLRPMLQKFEVSDLKGLRAYFEQLTVEQESRQEQLQEAEDKKRSEKRMASISGFIRAWRERLYVRDAKREQKAKRKARAAERKARAAARRTGQPDTSAASAPAETAAASAAGTAPASGSPEGERAADAAPSAGRDISDSIDFINDLLHTAVPGDHNDVDDDDYDGDYDDGYEDEYDPDDDYDDGYDEEDDDDYDDEEDDYSDDDE